MACFFAIWDMGGKRCRFVFSASVAWVNKNRCRATFVGLRGNLRGRQLSYKPSSVAAEATVCHLSKLAVACKHYRSTLRRNKVLGGQPSNAGLRELSTSHCTARTSPCARWALTPPSHPCSPLEGGCFLLQFVYPRG